MITAEDITEWLRNQLIQTNANGYVLGVSGGIDSTLLAKLLIDNQIPHKIIHIVSNQITNSDTINYIKSIDSENYSFIDASNIFQAYKNVFLSQSEIQQLHFPQNIEARIRGTIFYYYAKVYNYLVIGTVNKAEFNLGYFVKNSSIGDILPLADISKKEIRQLALQVGVPENICNEKASGCGNFQYAEQEWEMTEDDVDSFCDNTDIDNTNYSRFLKSKNQSEHKRKYPPIFKYE